MSLSLNRYQLLAKNTLRNDLSTMDQVTHMLFGMAGEVGEVIDHIKKSMFTGCVLSVDDLTLELGDVLFYLSGLATTLGISLETIASSNIGKLTQRYPDGFDLDRAVHRDVLAEKAAAVVLCPVCGKPPEECTRHE
jgi:NTP pyrophosphatase (non-canonical NTP hydrolase)